MYSCLLAEIQKKINETSVNFDELIKISEHLADSLKPNVEMNQQQDPLINLNIGGTHFVTLKTTLANTYFDSIISQPENCQRDSDNAVFIDRNPAYFSIILDFLRCQSTQTEFVIPHEINLRTLRTEAVFYRVDDLVQLIDKQSLIWKLSDLCKYLNLFRIIKKEGRKNRWKYWLLVLQIFLTGLAIKTHDNQTTSVRQEIITELNCEQNIFSYDITSSEILNSDQVTKLLTLCEFKTNQKFHLLYRGSKDGYSSDQFHSKCDNHSPTLTIIQSTDGYIFGGYSEATWDKYYTGYKVDFHAFLFTLVNKYNDPRKLLVKRGGAFEMFSIFSNSSCGPVFGDAFENSLSYSDDSEFDLFIADQSNLNNLSYTKLAYVNYRNGRLPTTEDPYRFKVTDIEVYKI